MKDSAMNSQDTLNYMKSHGYTRRVHFAGMALTDPTEIGAHGPKIELGAGAIEFTRDKQGDFVTKNLFTTVLLDRVYFSPEKNLFFAMAATANPAVHHSCPFSSTMQTWVGLSPQDLKQTLDKQAGKGQTPDSNQPMRRAFSRLLSHFTPPSL